MRQFPVLFFLIACFHVRAVAQAPQTLPNARASHFVDTLEPTITLPPGARLSSLQAFLKEKIRLRKDVQGAPLSKSEDFHSLYAATTLPAGRAILRSQVSGDIPDSLKPLIPPRRTLVTIVEPPQHLVNMSLCGPYDRISLMSAYTPPNGTSRFDLISTKARAISRETNFQSGSKDLSVVVVAIKEGLEQRFRLLRRGPHRHFRLECLKARKYD